MPVYASTPGFADHRRHPTRTHAHRWRSCGPHRGRDDGQDGDARQVHTRHHPGKAASHPIRRRRTASAGAAEAGTHSAAELSLDRPTFDPVPTPATRVPIRQCRGQLPGPVGPWSIDPPQPAPVGPRRWPRFATPESDRAALSGGQAAAGGRSCAAAEAIDRRARTGRCRRAGRQRRPLLPRRGAQASDRQLAVQAGDGRREGDPFLDGDHAHLPARIEKGRGIGQPPPRPGGTT